MKIYAPEVEHFRVSKERFNKFFRYHGWPSIARDERGVLYVVSSGMRMSHVCPAGKNVMYMSYDDGKTWTKPMVLNDSYVDDRDMGICYLGNGKFIVSWFAESPEDYHDHIQEYDFFGEADKKLTAGFSKAWKLMDKEEYFSYAKSFVMISEDYCVTWSDPIEVPIFGPHGPNLCKDGSLVYLGNYLYNASYSYKDENGEEVRPPLGCFISRDGGYTWEHQGDMPNGIADNGEEITPWEMFEPHVMELPDGRLIGAIRTHSANNEEINTTFITFSEDQGKTWTRPKGIGIDGMPAHLLMHSSGAIVMSYSCRTEGLRCERAVVSYDNGETWTQDYALDHRIAPWRYDMGYPASAELADGTIITIYYQSFENDGCPGILGTKWRLVKEQEKAE